MILCKPAPEFLQAFLGNCVDMASSSYPNSCALPQMLPPKYEEDTITQYRLMAHFSRHYLWVWPWSLTHFLQNWITWPGCGGHFIYANLEVYRRFRFDIWGHKMQS